MKNINIPNLYDQKNNFNVEKVQEINQERVSVSVSISNNNHEIIENIETIAAIELMNASQAMEFRRPKKSSELIESFLAAYREGVPFVDEDRLLADDIHTTVAFLQSFSVESELLFP